ncbi:MAG: leucine-rich repeat protein [Clostridia bacterium]|nr:leucine-rich repeat protein [Clostridia bacterium]
MNKTLKKTLSIILTILMLVTAIPMAFAADIVKSGTFGAEDDNLTWTLDSDGLLTISGTGDMKNAYQTGIYGWYYSGIVVRKVVIEEGVTNIDGDPFFNCAELVEVTIPESVTSIRDGVFSDIAENATVNVPCTWNEEMLYSFDSTVELNMPEHKWIHKGGNVYCENCNYLCNHFYLSDPLCSKCGYVNIIEDESKTVLDISKGDIVIADTYVTLNGEYIDVDPEGYIITGVSTGSENALKIINDSDVEKTFDLVFRNLLIDPAFDPIVIDDNSPIVLNILCDGSFSVTDYTVMNCISYEAKTGITVNITRPEGAVIDFKYALFADNDIHFDVYLNGKEIGSDMHFHENTDGTQTCMGYLCDVCWCYFGEGDESLHVTDGVQTCAGYYCSFCRYYFGEPDDTAHSWNRGYCYTCNSYFPEDMECAHKWSLGICDICGVKCSHDLDKNLICTVCESEMSFEVITGDSVKYYSVFDDAIDDFNNGFEDGSVIRLIKDCFDKRFSYIGFSGNDIVIDLNGHTWNPDYQSLSISSDIKIMDSVGGGYMGASLYLQSPITIYDGSYKEIVIVGEFDLSDLITDCYEADVGSTGDYNDDYYKQYSDVEIKAKHDIVKVEAQAPTCTEIGWDAYEYCTACDYTTYVEKEALDHDIIIDEAVDPKCGETGLTAGQHCSRCDAMTITQEVVPALTHKDDDGDYKCDYGCGHEFPKPVEPEQPDTPDEPEQPDEPADETCDHLCHKDGILGFFWKLIRFFYRLFNIQQYCDCGVVHYDAPVFG